MTVDELVEAPKRTETEYSKTTNFTRFIVDVILLNFDASAFIENDNFTTRDKDKYFGRRYDAF